MEELKNLMTKIIGTNYSHSSESNIVNDKERLQNLLGKESSDKFMDNVMAFNSGGNTAGAWKEKLQSFLTGGGAGESGGGGNASPNPNPSTSKDKPVASNPG